ncbi:hypothetical protein B7494_g2204 [Chlorociboria aeruginascens]|nr:hypothetical protein B7494_g2204 [Chlorociboria aeruginascens]
MRLQRRSPRLSSTFIRRFSSTRDYSFDHKGLLELPQIQGPLNSIDVNEFRQRFFVPEQPVLVTSRADGACGLPASTKWFDKSSKSPHALIPSQYLLQFSKTILPYELVIDSNTDYLQALYSRQRKRPDEEGAIPLSMLTEALPAGSTKFYRFSTFFSLFLEVCQTNPRIKQLYIAQAQVSDLPTDLRNDLPTPQLVKMTGKGDIYDTNIWLGIPPTYTPLHRDPNPNLFVQLISGKRVRLFRPFVGDRIFFAVKQRIGQNSSSTRFRGDEMMEGLEREVLDEAVWGESAPEEGFDVTVNPGDALFIPKGWWHSIKSIGEDVTFSANWWFR